LEIKPGFNPIVLAKYSIEEGNKLRTVFPVLGITQIVYLEITPEGLKDEDGTIYYSTANYEEARRAVLAVLTEKRYTTNLSHLLQMLNMTWNIGYNPPRKVRKIWKLN